MVWLSKHGPLQALVGMGVTHYSLRFLGILRKIAVEIRGISAQMAKFKKPALASEDPLDKVSGKRGKGRPQHIERETVSGHSENYRYQLAEVWARLSGPLVSAETAEQIIAAFKEHGQPYASGFVPRLASDILVLIRDRNFPKTADARIGFLADSLAGRPNVEFRTSRDICGKERAKTRAKSPHRIIRKEFYIECSCGYKGPALDDACRKCGAQIPISLRTEWGDPASFR